MFGRASRKTVDFSDKFYNYVWYDYHYSYDDGAWGDLRTTVFGDYK